MEIVPDNTDWKNPKTQNHLPIHNPNAKPITNPNPNYMLLRYVIYYKSITTPLALTSLGTPYSPGGTLT